MKDALKVGVLLFLFLRGQSVVFAQQPSLADSDLAYTRKLIEKTHFVAWVTLETQKDQLTRYQYDHYPAVERIKTDEGVSYARPLNQSWVKSEDWGKTGTAITEAVAGKLNTFASVVNAAFIKPKLRDLSQGGMV